MGRLAKRHTQHAWTSGGNNFRVRLLEELHCHTSTHEQLLHEGRAGIAIRAVTGIIPKVTSSRNYRKFHDHIFADAFVLLRGFKNIFLTIYSAIFAVCSLNHSFIDSEFLNVSR